jgi:hypothetical protein
MATLGIRLLLLSALISLLSTARQRATDHGRGSGVYWLRRRCELRRVLLALQTAHLPTYIVICTPHVTFVDLELAQPRRGLKLVGLRSWVILKQAVLRPAVIIMV